MKRLPYPYENGRSRSLVIRLSTYAEPVQRIAVDVDRDVAQCITADIVGVVVEGDAVFGNGEISGGADVFGKESLLGQPFVARYAAAVVEPVVDERIEYGELGGGEKIVQRQFVSARKRVVVRRPSNPRSGSYRRAACR